MIDQDKAFTYFWKDGTMSLLYGEDRANALNRAGYGAGALRALDFCSAGDTRQQYEHVNGEWKRKAA